MAIKRKSTSEYKANQQNAKKVKVKSASEYAHNKYLAENSRYSITLGNEKIEGFTIDGINHLKSGKALKDYKPVDEREKHAMAEYSMNILKNNNNGAMYASGKRNNAVLTSPGGVWDGFGTVATQRAARGLMPSSPRELLDVDWEYVNESNYLKQLKKEKAEIEAEKKLIGEKKDDYQRKGETARRSGFSSKSDSYKEKANALRKTLNSLDVKEERIDEQIESYKAVNEHEKNLLRVSRKYGIDPGNFDYKELEKWAKQHGYALVGTAAGAEYRPTYKATEQEQEDYAVLSYLASMDLAEKTALNHPTLASVGTVVTAPLRGIGGALGTVEDALDTASGRGINLYSRPRKTSGSTNVIRSTVRDAYASKWFDGAENKVVGNVGEFVYDTAMSVGDNIANLLLAKAFVGGIGLTGTQATSWTSKITSGLLASDATYNAITNAKMKGLSDTKALALGISTGTVELLTEKYSLDNALKKPKGFTRSLFKGFVAEGSEEVAANVSGKLLDRIISGEESDIVFAINEYKKDGKSDKDALIYAIGDSLLDDLRAGLSGGFSGMGMSGAYHGINRVKTSRVGRNIASGKYSDVSLENVIAKGLDYKSGTDIRQKAEAVAAMEMGDNNKNSYHYKIGELAMEILADDKTAFWKSKSREQETESSENAVTVSEKTNKSIEEPVISDVAKGKAIIHPDSVMALLDERSKILSDKYNLDYQKVFNANREAMSSKESSELTDNVIMQYADALAQSVNPNTDLWMELGEHTDDIGQFIFDSYKNGYNSTSANIDGLLKNFTDILDSVSENAVDMHRIIYGDMSNNAKSTNSTNYTLTDDSGVPKIREELSQNDVDGIVSAMHDTLKQNALHGLSNYMKKSGNLSDIDKLARMLINIYRDNGNIVDFGKFFKDDGMAVVDAIKRTGGNGYESKRAIEGRTLRDTPDVERATGERTQEHSEDVSRETGDAQGTASERTIRKQIDDIIYNEVARESYTEDMTAIESENRAKYGVDTRYYSGHAVDGVGTQLNGFYYKGTLYLQIDDAQPINSIRDHEITHHFGKSKAYETFRKAVRAKMSAEQFNAWKAEVRLAYGDALTSYLATKFEKSGRALTNEQLQILMDDYLEEEMMANLNAETVNFAKEYAKEIADFRDGIDMTSYNSNAEVSTESKAKSKVSEYAKQIDKGKSPQNTKEEILITEESLARKEFETKIGTTVKSYVSGNTGKVDGAIINEIGADSTIKSLERDKFDVSKAMNGIAEQTIETDKPVEIVYVPNSNGKGIYAMYFAQTKDSRGGQIASINALGGKTNFDNIYDMEFVNETGFVDTVNGNEDADTTKLSQKNFEGNPEAVKQLVNDILEGKRQVTFTMDDIDVNNFNEVSCALFSEVSKYLPDSIKANLGFKSQSFGSMPRYIRVGGVNSSVNVGNALNIDHVESASGKYVDVINELFNMSDIQRERVINSIAQIPATVDVLAANIKDIKSDKLNDSNALRRSIVGIKSLTADKEAYNKAIEMDKQGYDIEELWEETGWSKGVDGHFKSEIDDSKYEFMMPSTSKENLYVKDLVKHDELFAAYPQLKDIPVLFDENMDEYEGEAMYWPDGGKHISGVDELGLIRINPKKDISKLKKSMLHELQHVIQFIEGFAQGASESYWLQRIKEGYDIGNINDYLQLNVSPAHQLYEDTAGEREARDVVDRMNFTLEERRKIFPYSMDDSEGVVFADGSSVAAFEKGTKQIGVMWTIQQGILDKKEVAAFYSKVSELRNNKYRTFRQSADGDYIFSVDNKLIYTDADYEYPKIKTVITFETDDENLIDYARECFYEGETYGRRFEDTKKIAEIMLGEGTVKRADYNPNATDERVSNHSRESESGTAVDSRSGEDVRRSISADTQDRIEKIGREEIFSVPKSVTSKLSNQIERWLNGEMTSNEMFEFGNTPVVLRELGAENLPVIMSQNTMVKLNGEKHSVSLENIRNLPQNLAEPLMVFKSATVPNAYIVLTSMEDMNGDTIIAALHLNKKENRLKVNRVASIYGKYNVAKFVGGQTKLGNLKYIDKTKSQEWSTSRGLQLPKLVQSNPDNNSILEREDIVNKYYTQKKYKNSERTGNVKFSVVASDKLTEDTKIEREWAKLLDKYGAIETGANPVRDIKVPKKSDSNNYVSQFARTLFESDMMPDDMIDDFKEEVLNHKVSRIPITDKDAKEYALNKIKKLGFDGAIQYWNALADAENVPGKNDVVLGEVLLNQCLTADNVELSMKIAVDLAHMATRSGQATQAFSMLKKMSPDGKLYHLEKSVQTLNREMKQQLGKKGKGLNIKLNKELARRYLAETDKAKSQKLLDEIHEDIARQIPATNLDRWDAWRYLSMLGNPRTHFRNIVGNFIMVPTRKLKNFIGAISEGIAVSTGMMEEGQRTKSITRNKDALEFAKNDFKNAQDIIKGYDGKYDIKYGEINERRTIFKNRYLEGLRKFNIEAMEAEDGWFLKMAYADALAQAMTARKVTPEFLNSGTRQAITELEHMRNYAIKEALEATFRDANLVAEMMNKGKNWVRKSGNPLAKVGWYVGVEGIMPFKTTPLNILKRGVEYSPAYIVKALSYDIARVRNEKMTADEMINDLAKGLTGTALLALGYLLAKWGLLIGADDEDKKKRKFDETIGFQGYALKLGDFGTYTIDWAAPTVMPIFVGVELYNSFKEDGTNLQSLAKAMGKITEPVLALSCLQGISSALEAASFNDTSEISAVCTDAVASYAMQAVPTLGGQIARTADKTRHTIYINKNSNFPETIQMLSQQFAAKMPFLSYALEPRLDAWGREMTYGENAALRGISNFVSPGYARKIDNSKVTKELNALYERSGDNSVFPVVAQKSVTIGETDIKRYPQLTMGKINLTGEQYTFFAKARGQNSLKIVTELINSPNYKGMTDEEKVKALKNCYEDAGAMAKDELIRKYFAN